MAKTRVVSGDLFLGLLFVGFLIAGAVGVYYALRRKEKLRLPRTGTFSNNEYQIFPSSTTVERAYHQCVQTKCDGNMFDQDCLDICYLQSHREGMPAEDIQGKICSGLERGSDEYHRCLEHQYSDNRFM